MQAIATLLSTATAELALENDKADLTALLRQALAFQEQLDKQIAALKQVAGFMPPTAVLLEIMRLEKVAAKLPDAIQKRWQELAEINRRLAILAGPTDSEALMSASIMKERQAAEHAGRMYLSGD